MAVVIGVIRNASPPTLVATAFHLGDRRLSEKIITTRKVSIQGVDYAEGADVSGVDSGAIESMLSVGWAKKIEFKNDIIPEDFSTESGVIVKDQKKNKERK